MKLANSKQWQCSIYSYVGDLWKCISRKPETIISCYWYTNVIFSSFLSFDVNAWLMLYFFLAVEGSLSSSGKKKKVEENKLNRSEGVTLASNQRRWTPKAGDLLNFEVKFVAWSCFRMYHCTFIFSTPQAYLYLISMLPWCTVLFIPGIWYFHK